MTGNRGSIVGAALVALSVPMLLGAGGLMPAFMTGASAEPPATLDEVKAEDLPDVVLEKHSRPLKPERALFSHDCGALSGLAQVAAMFAVCSTASCDNGKAFAWTPPICEQR